MTWLGTPPVIVPLATRQDQTIAGTAATWYPAPDAVEIELSSEIIAGIALRVRVKVKASAGTVTARLYNLTTSAAAGTGTAKTSTTFVEDTFAIAVATGRNRYRLELSPGTTGADIGGIGLLESAQ